MTSSSSSLRRERKKIGNDKRGLDLPATVIPGMATLPVAHTSGVYFVSLLATFGVSRIRHCGRKGSSDVEGGVGE